MYLFNRDTTCLIRNYKRNKAKIMRLLLPSLNPFNASCSKLLLFEGFSAILV